VIRPVARLKLKGIASVSEGKRFYPKQEQGAHLLGFVGTDDRGLEGLELQYDAFLAGKPKWVVRQQDALGRPIFREEAFKRPPHLNLIFLVGHPVGSEQSIPRNPQFGMSMDKKFEDVGHIPGDA